MRGAAARSAAVVSSSLLFPCSVANPIFLSSLIRAVSSIFVDLFRLSFILPSLSLSCVHSFHCIIFSSSFGL